MFHRTVLAGLCCLACASALFSASLSVAQDDTTGRLLTWVALPRSTDAKTPHIAADGQNVVIVSNANRRDALVWTKAAATDSFGEPYQLGAADGEPPYSTASVAIGTDRRIYAAWINQAERAIYLRVRGADGIWGPRRQVNRGSPFPIDVEVAVAGDGAIFVAWRDPDQPNRFRRSIDGGANWSPATPIADRAIDKGGFSLVAGPGERIGMAWTQPFDDELHIYVGLWNGQGFNIQRVTGGTDGYSSPTLTFSPAGQPIVAYRGIAQRGGNSGVFFAARQPDGSWPRSRLMSGDTLDTVNVLADVDGGLHMVWLSRASGSSGLYYATWSTAGTWRGPFMVSGGSASLFNARAAVGDAGQRYVHAVGEYWAGSKPVVRYGLFQASTAVVAIPTLEGGAPITRGRDTVRVSFSEVRGAPTEVRWRWDSPPSDAASDSGGWRPFFVTLDVPVAPPPPGAAPCLPRTLYTQVRNAATVQREPAADAILLDTSVDVAVSAVNPLLPGAPGQAESASRFPAAAVHATIDAGDPSYTRVPLTWLRVGVLGDCSGLRQITLSRSSAGPGLRYPLDANGMSALVPLPDPGAMANGPLEFFTVVEDAVGNTRSISQRMVVDRSPPVLDPAAPGTLGVVSDPHATILQTLTISGASVSDDYYPGRGFWGLAIAASRTPVEAPATDETLRWSAAVASGEGPEISVRGWSLASSLSPSVLTPGDYYLYVRFVDGAGNVSNGLLSGKVTLPEVTYPLLRLPIVRR